MSEPETNDAERRTGEAVDHLRAAAHELIGALRGFLDVAEQLVDDPSAGDAVMDTVSGLADAARRGTRSAMKDTRRSDEFEHIDLDD